MFGSTSKKRPDNLILGRMYEHELLDMVELGIKQYKGLQDFKNDKIGTCVKPCLVFNGPKWGQTEEYRRLKSLFIDAFHRDTVSDARIQSCKKFDKIKSFLLIDSSNPTSRHRTCTQFYGN